ncbi:MAG: cytochrome C oxidase subunit IV family protein [Gemmatimonadales bacterium]|nr:cytochrome C oxidase subunit IV family protein [Gemmatimonadales bacterium]
MATVEHKHPNYIAIWIYLAVLTGVELLVAMLHFLPRQWLIGLLIFLAIWKALLVALYFMHLKFEPKRLVVMILAPLPLAVILVMIILQEFGR